MICKNCIHSEVCKHKTEAVYSCEHFKDGTIKNQYDRIRNMSVEEMTAFITKLAFFPCELCEREHNASCTHENCFNIHKQWLESEVTE